MFEFSDKTLLDIQRVSGGSEILRYAVPHRVRIGTLKAYPFAPLALLWML